ncbi:MAG: tetraacyldisaccharide 4'-kinase [Rickettsiales bacterium]|nr:tetraacyldisaccharide 4'-kinase [Rickettsiales bacterium]OUV53265.1 MAG: tetraacyldisaccharide 4'-kinase [Rickettsiales bacterium TMED127]|tara:strand:- start:25322 stop:26284 length:963 start_codon:yes stop_codon:yes gene_type:complete
MKKPKFWKKRSNIFDVILKPLSIIYILLSLLNTAFKKEKRMKVPVLCVGNLIMGGAGKTPTVIAISDLLVKNFNLIHILMRGYKGKNSKAKLVDENDNIASVGDEALIHFENNQVCISRNRYIGAELCQKNGADLIILDDGFQSKHIVKNLSFVVVDNYFQFGNKKVFPAGPLREPLFLGFKRADAVILIKNIEDKIFDLSFSKLPIFFAKKVIILPKLKKKNALAFCGIGNPENFFQSLKDYKVNVKHKLIFPDHHMYEEKEIKNIIKSAEKSDLQILTTKKDFIKIHKKYHSKIKMVDMYIKFEKEEKLKQFILSNLK